MSLKIQKLKLVILLKRDSINYVNLMWFVCTISNEKKHHIRCNIMMNDETLKCINNNLAW